MKNLSLASKVLLAFTIPLGLVYYFLVIPQIRATAQGLVDVDALRQTSTSASSTKQRDDFKQKVAAVQTQANLLLPPTDQQYDLSVQVESLAKSKNLTISGLSVNAAQPTNLQKTTPAANDTTSEGPSTITAADAPLSTAAVKVTVSVGVTGTYANIEQFIAGLPALDRFVQIDQVTITNQAAGQLGAQLTAFAYYLPASK